MRRARLQEAVGEAAGGRADVQAARAAHLLAERLERPLQLPAAARDEALAALHRDLRIDRHTHGRARGVRVAHLHFAREHRAQRRVRVRAVAPLHEQRVESLFLHAGIIRHRPRAQREAGVSPPSSREPQAENRARRADHAGAQTRIRTPQNAENAHLPDA